MAKLYYRKGKRAAAKAKWRKKSKNQSYADKHNFKFAGVPTLIQTGVSSPTPVGSGSIVINSTAVPGVNKALNNISGAFQLTLQQVNLPNLSMINTNFDRYRVNKIKIRVIPQCNVADVIGAGVIPVMKVVRDYDDFKVPTIADVWSRRGSIHLLNKPFTLSLVPKIPMVLGTNVTGGYAVMKSTWINMAYPNVPLFGIKFGIKDFYNTATGSNSMQVRFEIMYYISVKEQLAVQSTSDEYPELTLGEDGLVRDASGNVVADHSELQEGELPPL